MATGDERCKDCYSYLENTYLYCLVPPYSNGKKCPCLTCLIQVMCTTVCLEYEEYIIHTEI